MPLEWGFLIGRAIQTLQIQAPEATLQTKLIVEMAPAMEVNTALLALLIAVLVPALAVLIQIILPAIIVQFLMVQALKTGAIAMKITIAQTVITARTAVALMHASGLIMAVVLAILQVLA